MKQKESIKERLSRKSIRELKAIYVRRYGHDLLRGSKAEMVHTLATSLDSRRFWNAIIGK